MDGEMREALKETGLPKKMNAEESLNTIAEQNKDFSMEKLLHRLCNTTCRIIN